MRIQHRAVSLVVAMIVVLAACSSGGATAAPSSAPATIALGDSSLGQIIVDASGKSLYLFTPDSAGEPTCYDDCASTWPPLLVTGDAVAGIGLDASKLSTVERTDGTKQVKYGAWPLYYFAADAAAGETKGQGLGEKWYVVGAAGDAIK